MASTVFHRFTQLPVELRLQIWEAACQPVPTGSNRGLHYVAAEGGLIVAMPHNWFQSPVTGDTSRSAFLLDGGLWKACKESREAIVKHTRFYDWARVHKRATPYDPLDSCHGDWAGGDNSTHPAFIETSEGEEQCRVLVYPHMDIFCIQVDDWRSLPQETFDFDLEMEFVCSNRRLSPPSLIVANVAVQFDSSWIENIPNCLSRLQEENSARGFFGSLLLEYHRDLGYLDALWIVDKEAWWFDRPSRDHATVYRDGDEEYIEVDWSHIIPSRPSASKFMEKIDNFLVDYYGPSHFYTRRDFRPRDIFRLLVRRNHGEINRSIGP